MLTGEAKASRLSLRGKVRPFDSVPGYHLRGTWRPPSDFAGGRMSPVQLRIDGRGGAANIATTLELAGGAVRADGAVRLGSPVRYSIRRGTVEHLEIPAGSSINARFTLLGAGTEPSTALVDAQVDLLSSTVAARRIDSLRADVTLRGGRLSVRTRGTAEGAGVALEADARPFETTTSFQVRRASLQQVDLQRLFPGLGITTRASVEASGSLADGLATFRADVRDSSGRVTLAGTSRPLDSVPTLELQDVRLEDVNLARLLNDPKFDSRLRGHMTGRARGTSLRDAASPPPSTSKAPRSGARCSEPGGPQSTLEGGKLRLDGRARRGAGQPGGEWDGRLHTHPRQRDRHGPRYPGRHRVRRTPPGERRPPHRYPRRALEHRGDRRQRRDSLQPSPCRPADRSLATLSPTESGFARVRLAQLLGHAEGPHRCARGGCDGARRPPCDRRDSRRRGRARLHRPA